MRFEGIMNDIMEFRNLSEDEAHNLMEMIMDGEMGDVQIAALLTALAMKGETVDEITGFARAMRERAVKVKTPESMKVVDACGTGGDRFKSYNVSTAAAIIAAAAGVKVAKHGNRAVTGSCGGADILEAAGVNIELGPEAARRSLETLGIAFMFAPLFHRATARVAPVRRELGFKTVFNILGPLTSPASAEVQLLGVFDPYLVGPVAEVLRNLGVKRAMVVHGFDDNMNPAMDEISTVGPTLVGFLEDDEIGIERLMPSDFGVDVGQLQHLRAASTVDENLRMFLDVLAGLHDTPGRKSRLDIALANAGALIYLAEIEDTLKDGTEAARETVESGAALRLMEDFASFTQNL